MAAKAVHDMLVEILKMDPVARSRAEFHKWYAEHISNEGKDTNIEADQINEQCEREASAIAKRIAGVAKKGMYAEWYRLVKGNIDSDKKAEEAISICAEWIHQTLDELGVKGASFPMGGLYAVEEYLKSKNKDYPTK